MRSAEALLAAHHKCSSAPPSAPLHRPRILLSPPQPIYTSQMIADAPRNVDPNIMPNDSTPRALAIESPPTYEYATSGPSSPPPTSPPLSPRPRDAKVNPVPPALPALSQSYSVQPVPTYGATASPGVHVYRYQHPITGETVVSFLPPDHPQMVCLQEGRHLAESRFGILGVLAAIVWFPLGIGLCLLDRKVRCRRCGEILDEGMCG
ncbi:hypothetical protein FA95DRAFT_1529013 [Auriscalpium vulgare]|uniref:Uncharacterized protein n=1 Tax=Auriscalpium vulgare TaxID=40419 RepID=A0ACB8R458_9AGAM|nr:hypothetical protein FA95DRAFT_1529013 [Auriscalpium vulgare]